MGNSRHRINKFENFERHIRRGWCICLGIRLDPRLPPLAPGYKIRTHF